MQHLTPVVFDQILGTQSLRTITGLRNRVLLLLMHDAGLRKGEAIRLTIGDYHQDEHPILHIRNSKNGKSRSVPVTKRLHDHIEAWLPHHPTKHPASPLVCTTRTVRTGVAKAQPPGSMLSHGEPWNVLRRAGAKAGLDIRLHPHMLRHSYATNLLNHPAYNVEEVRVLLGHRHLHTTQRYLHTNNQELARKLYTAPPNARIPEPNPTPPPPTGSGLGDGSASSEAKPCPYCAEQIRLAAVYCRYCKHYLDDRHVA